MVHSRIDLLTEWKMATFNSPGNELEVQLELGRPIEAAAQGSQDMKHDNTHSHSNGPGHLL